MLEEDKRTEKVSEGEKEREREEEGLKSDRRDSMMP